jgi:hypothetical protein
VIILIQILVSEDVLLLSNVYAKHIQNIFAKSHYTFDSFITTYETLCKALNKYPYDYHEYIVRLLLFFVNARGCCYYESTWFNAVTTSAHDLMLLLREHIVYCC